MLFPIAIEKPANPQQCYGVIVPDIAGCFSAGDTLDEAIKNAKEAMYAHLDLIIQDGDQLPQATNITNHQNNPDYHGMVWALVDIDMSLILEKSENINVALPSHLIAKIDEKIQAQQSRYKSRSNYLAQLALADLT